MEGGTCPIAVGLTLRRLVAKCGEFCIAESIGAALDPLHPGCGTPSVWISSSYCMLTCMWSGLQECFQQPAWGETRSLKQLGLPLQHYTHLCTHCRVVIRLYSVSNHILQSEEGYPLGHLLFCTTIHPFTGSRCYYIYGWWGQLSLYYICDCTYMCMQIVELLVWAKNAHFSIISKC